MAEKSKQPGKPEWHAVSVVPQRGACEAAMALRGKRFLSRAATTKLPLPECTSPGTCQCVYKHYQDRRAGPRREIERIGINHKTPKVDQRARRGRRESDDSADR